MMALVFAATQNGYLLCICMHIYRYVYICCTSRYEDTIRAGLPGTLPVLWDLKSSVPKNSIQQTKYLRFFEVTKMRHF
jgi:hypothetical protein